MKTPRLWVIVGLVLIALGALSGLISGGPRAILVLLGMLIALVALSRLHARRTGDGSSGNPRDRRVPPGGSGMGPGG